MEYITKRVKVRKDLADEIDKQVKQMGDTVSFDFFLNQGLAQVFKPEPAAPATPSHTTD